MELQELGVITPTGPHTTIQAAINTALKSPGAAVWIPAWYTVGDSVPVNPGVPVIDMRGSSGVFTAASSASSPGSYTFSVSGAGTITATPNVSGLPTFSGSDMAVVWNSVTAQLATVGGRLFLKAGVYNANSATLESATGCSNFAGSGSALAYVLGFPSNTPFSSAVKWVVEGETAQVWQGEIGSTLVNNTGVVINVTPTAVSSVAAGTFIAGLFPRPVTNCNLTATNTSNDVEYTNIVFRFPTNTRGNEGSFVSWFADTVKYESVIADFNLPYNSIATGSAPTAGTIGSFGITSSVSSAGNWQDFTNTYAVGYNLGYDFQSEHVTGRTVTAIYNGTAGEFGRNGTAVFHPIIIQHFVDQENLNGLLLGPQMLAGSRIDILGLDLELGSSNWYARTTGAMVETNPGFTSGMITYQVVTQNGGIVAETPSTSLFTSGGQNFQMFEGTASPNIAQNPATVNFALMPNLAGSWTPAFVKNSAGAQFNITSGLAKGNPTGQAHYAAQNAGPDQFSKLTVGAISGTTAVGALVRASVTSGTQTYYYYACSTSGGVVPKRTIDKVIAGVDTALIATAANSGCSVNDTLELDAIGSTLIGFYNGVVDLIATDSSISSGLPGFEAVLGTGAGVSLWSGGNLTSGFSQLAGASSSGVVAPTYNTVSNCNPGSSVSPTACGSAASGTVVVPTTTATYTVNTTAVTANSRIIILPITDNSGLTGGPTCTAPPTPFIAYESGRTAGVSFTFTLPSTTGASCWTYWIIN